MTDTALENRPDQPADHIGAQAAVDTLDRPHPWARFWAKMVDTGVFAGLGVIGMLLAGWNGRSADLWVWALLVAVFPAVEALLIAGARGTPGKAVFRITVTQNDGARLPVLASLKRSYLALLIGSGLSLPVVSFAANIVGFIDYVRHGSVRWDRMTGARTTAQPNGQSWIVLCVIGLVTVMFLVLMFLALAMQE